MEKEIKSNQRQIEEMEEEIMAKNLEHERIRQSKKDSHAEMCQPIKDAILVLKFNLDKVLDSA